MTSAFLVATMVGWRQIRSCLLAPHRTRAYPVARCVGVAPSGSSTFGYHELVQPSLWTGYVPLLTSTSALADICVLGLAVFLTGRTRQRLTI